MKTGPIGPGSIRTESTRTESIRSGRRPRIAVTGPDRGGWPAWFFTALAVWRSGGHPFRVRPARPRHDRCFDGLIIGGGADVDPTLYGPGEDPGEVPDPQEIRRTETRWSQRLIGYVFYPLLWLLRRWFQSPAGPLDQNRDRLEKALIHQALEARRPVLGICRGMQLINVVRGGTLNRDLASFYIETPQARSLLPVKRVNLSAQSRLATLLARETLRVNALHDQAVATLGRHLRAVACEANGVIQAIEATDGWCIGVQWHPEYLPQKQVQQRLFRALVRAAEEPAESGPLGIADR